ncbi:MAG TPA: alpha/beta fold hydrolase [Acidimicrobiales bacterium]|nr:alpha/beta fold hydrolase [Acidimicrobiales bacterium]
MPRAKANGIELEYDTFGEPGDPAMLLVMGLGAQMIAWDEGLCRLLADAGFFVIRYDNRDVGLSTKSEEAGVPDLPAALTAAMTGQPLSSPYTLGDMADDGIALLGELGIERAHIVGASMGGMIVQAMAIRHPEQVLSLCSIMSTTGSQDVGQPDPEAMALLVSAPPANREEAIEAGVKGAQVIGSPGFPFEEDKIRARAAAAYDRMNYPAGMVRQLVAIVASEDRTPALRQLDVPTLVVHGDADRLVTPSGGQATADAIPGAELLIIPGAGHDLPEGCWPTVVEAIVANAARAVLA